MKTLSVRSVRSVPVYIPLSPTEQERHTPIRTMGQWYLVSVFYICFYRVFYSKPVSQNGLGQWWTEQDRGRA